MSALFGCTRILSEKRSVCSSQVEFSHKFIEMSLNLIYVTDFYKSLKNTKEVKKKFGQDLLGRDLRKKCLNY